MGRTQGGVDRILNDGVEVVQPALALDFSDDFVITDGGDGTALVAINTSTTGGKVFHATHNITGSPSPSLTVAVDNKTITVPEGVYASGEIQVYRNGQRQYIGSSGSGTSVEETDPANGIYTLSRALTSTEGLDTDYLKT